MDPENNDDVESAFEETVNRYKKANCIVYDRTCGFAPNKMKLAKFKQIKYWPVDPFHNLRHSDKCKYSPKNVPSYKRRLRGVNGSVCEQTFSWFRGYARTLNEMSPLRHHFLVLVYVKRK